MPTSSLAASVQCVSFIRGTMTYYCEVEVKIAQFLGFEAALTFISCWDANIGLVPTLAGSKTVRDYLVHTSRSHLFSNSLPPAVRAGSTAAIGIFMVDPALAIQARQALFDRGVFVSGFDYPVVPKGEVRVRCRICATHTREEIDQAVEAFREVSRELKLAG